MGKKITHKELTLLSGILEVDVELLTRVKVVIDPVKLYRLLIEKEYQEKVQDKKYRKKQIIEALTRKYKVSKSSIEHIIYGKVSNKEKFCTKCGAAISKYKSTHNKGVCDTCIHKEINQK